MVKGYIYLTTIIGILIWFFIGFILWIPVILIGISNFFFDVFKSTLGNSTVDSDSNIRLRNKIDMYPRGFRNFEIILDTYKTYGNNN